MTWVRFTGRQRNSKIEQGKKGQISRQRGRGKERERDKDSEGEREGERQRERKTDREKEIEREREREREKDREGEREREKERDGTCQVASWLPRSLQTALMVPAPTSHLTASLRTPS